MSCVIFEEYQRIGQALEKKFKGAGIAPMLHLVTLEAEVRRVPKLSEGVCEDPDDDKFLACAAATKTKIVVSGDKKLLAVSGYFGIKVIPPRRFIDEYLS